MPPGDSTLFHSLKTSGARAICSFPSVFAIWCKSCCRNQLARMFYRTQTHKWMHFCVERPLPIVSVQRYIIKTKRNQLAYHFKAVHCCIAIYSCSVVLMYSSLMRVSNCTASSLSADDSYSRLSLSIIRFFVSAANLKIAPIRRKLIYQQL